MGWIFEGFRKEVTMPKHQMMLPLKIIRCAVRVRQLHRKSNIPTDGFFGLPNQLFGKFQLDAAHQSQFNNAGIHATGIVTRYGGQVQVPHPVKDFIHDVIKAEVLGNKSLDLLIHGVLGIGLVLDRVAILVGFEESGLG